MQVGFISMVWNDNDTGFVFSWVSLHVLNLRGNDCYKAKNRNIGRNRETWTFAKTDRQAMFKLSRILTAATATSQISSSKMHFEHKPRHVMHVWMSGAWWGKYGLVKRTGDQLLSSSSVAVSTSHDFEDKATITAFWKKTKKILCQLPFHSGNHHDDIIIQIHHCVIHN